MLQCQNERIIPARSNYALPYAPSNNKTEASRKDYECKLSFYISMGDSCIHNCYGKKDISASNKFYLILAMAFRVQVVHKCAIVIGISTSICLRVVAVTYF